MNWDRDFSGTVAGDDAPITPRVVQCARRGEEVRQQECPSCRGTTRVKIFACEAFGECCLSTKNIGVARCVPTCAKFVAAPARASST